MTACMHPDHLVTHCVRCQCTVVTIQWCYQSFFGEHVCERDETIPKQWEPQGRVMILLLYDSTGCMCIAFWPRHSLAPSSVLWQPPTGCVLSSAQHSTTGKLHSMMHHVYESEVILMISSTHVCPVTIDLSCAPFFTFSHVGIKATEHISKMVAYIHNG